MFLFCFFNTFAKYFFGGRKQWIELDIIIRCDGRSSIFALVTPRTSNPNKRNLQLNRVVKKIKKKVPPGMDFGHF